MSPQTMLHQRIAIFCALCVALSGQEFGREQMSLETCCKSGRVYGLGNQQCASLPRISHSFICRMAQKQCCQAALEESLCTNGRTSAKRNGVCDFSFFETDPYKANTAMMCCECCVLGLLAQRDNRTCELQIPVTVHCRNVARACCMEKEHGLVHQVSPLLSNTSTGKGGNTQGTDLCAEGVTRCSQLCVGNGSCVCLRGFHLKSDGYSCEDYNECLSGAHTCRPGERCINTEGSYRCQRETSCGTGYELTNTNICQDIDECLVGTHNCGREFTCQNTVGSFRCHPRHQCGLGFIQDAVGNCIDINECVHEKSPCQPGHTCVNTVGSYMCQRFSVTCGRGYHLNEEGTHCMDVDECSTPHNACQGHDCVNLLGSFRCDCRSGFTFNSISKSCEDNDECRSYPGRLCAHKCDNTPGSYRCSCHPGFQLASDGKSCEDVNECENSPCSQECANVYGSYQCYCHRGYQLNNIDRHTCEDIDECALTSGGKVCSYHCLNTPGSYECTCPPTGYSLSPSGRTCLDVDECATGTHNCSAAQSCFNILGGFRCLSFECPPKYRRAAESRCERLPCEQNSECQSLPLTISFYNLTFPTNIPIPAAVFRMGPSRSVPGDDIQLFIADGDAEGFFSIQKTAHGAVVSVQRPLPEPRDFLLTVEIRLIRYGIISIFVAKIAVFVVNDQPIVPNSWPKP
ncbi:fibulin-1 [Pangasianodon hypophthalmus]|uniref:fibulin-1 n=1 Tax=Pangasianodon hypophthalmus TaxID=310915 RepID=UPI002308056A|nr:fibulin-1 [Pangasianodon hypophthalmus]